MYDNLGLIPSIVDRWSKKSLTTNSLKVRVCLGPLNCQTLAINQKYDDLFFR